MKRHVMEFLTTLPVELQLKITEYITRGNLREDKIGCADLALILLRLNTPESLRAASELTGRNVTRCPPAVPPWPPKPVAQKPRVLVVLRKSKESPKGEHMANHFANVKIGMDREQMLAHGATQRDIRYWLSKGYIEMGTR